MPFPLLGLLTAALISSPPTEEWRLDQTWAVVSGVLSWNENALPGFSDENRQDELVYETLVRRGMPEGQGALLLDEHATQAAIEAELIRLASAAPPEATFVFYYAGHGQKRDDRYFFASYDATSSGGGLDVDRVGEILRRHFRGRRVLLFADCCHSGSLRRAVDELAVSGVAAASVTSVVPECLSTGNWTFTQTLLEGLRGDPSLDRDADGDVDLAELERAVFEAMAWRESQRSGSSIEGIESDWTIATCESSTGSGAGFRIGQHVRVPGSRRSQVGKVVGHRGEELVVRLYSYARTEEVIWPSEECQPVTATEHALGSTVLVNRRGTAGLATVVRRDGPFHWVEFVDFPSLRGTWAHGRELTSATDGPDIVMVEWRGTWYPATILETEGERSLIHYVGIGSNWDEWVEPTRLKQPARESDGE